MIDSVATLLMDTDLYEQVETAMYDNIPAQAQEIMLALCDWPTGKTRSSGKYGCVLLTKGPKRILKISSLAMSSEQYKNTLLHEIAHIIAWMIFNERGHGWHFRRCARMVGCDLNMAEDSLFSESVAAHVAKKMKLVAVCSGCGREWRRVRRLRRNYDYSCPDCNCRIDTI